MSTRDRISDSDNLLQLPELRIVLLGYRLAGKSSAGNTILGKKLFNSKETTALCMKRQGEVAGRWVTVVDTPGWWWNEPAKWTSERVRREIVVSRSICPPGPHIFLLVIRGDDSFTEEYRMAVQEHLELLGETVWRKTLVLFTRGDCLGDSIEQHIESEGKALLWLVEKCGNRYHVLDNKYRGDGPQVTELLEKIEEMVVENNGDGGLSQTNWEDWSFLKKRGPLRRTNSMSNKIYRSGGSISDNSSLGASINGSIRSAIDRLRARSLGNCDMASLSSGIASMSPSEESSQSSRLGGFLLPRILRRKKNLSTVNESDVNIRK
ncbi:GTPase IMAP family member 9 [Esox lucius]|uniref:AIG1-type G domain-containing protein n=1 Tax=Esox lucius TaxID=8010 RepID=A0A3P9AQH5_ESOLU|nr:GTPase IMAP family member 9 [Esox lucius]XP_019909401.1 GTPase IMAP family member 9 [Esox lucius]XP_019909402.1 GTPase IMAP family member 9 [Esox lucius]